ncbi:MAG TPA: MBL fold metallo-hydrolase [Candidatus Limnocylindrales bacterium]|nr:MBL fold metallo-hydrolase [Candidatus Limnocylindrales bacterium]
MAFERVTPNVRTDITIRGCNPSYVVTSDGVVVVDTAQLPTRAVAMREEAESNGPIRYLINTEHHVDHIFGNYFFKGAGTVIHHRGVADNFMLPTPLLDPFDYAAEAIPMSDPDGAEIMPSREVYFQDPNRAQITFTGDVVLKVGDHTFNLIHTPGHTPGQIAVHVPEERVVFTGDTVFSEVQTWVMASDVDQWIEALNTISRLDVDHVIPGHGPVTNLRYLQTQKAVLLEWKSMVATAVARGWSREETIERCHMRDRYPVDIGQEYMMDYIQKHNAGILWDRLSANEV